MKHSKILQIHGHRGARGLFPENTIKGFIEAIKMGVTAIELDVVISKDLKVVVSHEEWMNELFCLQPNGLELEKPTQEQYNLYAMPYSDIAQYDCGTKINRDFPLQQSYKTHKPLLSEVIYEVENFINEQHVKPILYNIEIKSAESGDRIYHPTPDVFVELVLKELNVLLRPQRYLLQSFDIRILQEIKRINSHIKIGLLIENENSYQDNLSQLGFKPDFYNPEFYLVTPSLLEYLHHQHIQVIPWTVNETSDMQHLINLGVDGLITDYPNKAIELIKSF